MPNNVGKKSNTRAQQIIVAPVTDLKANIVYSLSRFPRPLNNIFHE